MIIGIDPGINKTHGVVLNDDGGYLDDFSINVPTDTKRGREAMYGRTKPQYIADELFEEIIALGARPGRVFIEEPVAAGVKNLRTVIQMGRACGAIEAALATLGLIPKLVPVDTWKKQVLGKGGLGKDQIREWVKTTHPGVFKALGGNQDLCDAYCIARYGMAVTWEVERGGAVHPNTHPTHRSVVSQRYPRPGYSIYGPGQCPADVGSSEPVREPRNPKLARGGVVRKGVN